MLAIISIAGLITNYLARRRGYSPMYMGLSLVLGILGWAVGIAASIALSGSFAAFPRTDEAVRTAVILGNLGALLGSGSVCVWLQCLPNRAGGRRGAFGSDAHPPRGPDAERDLVAEWRKAREALNRPQE
jgi:hypothetical protein